MTTWNIIAGPIGPTWTVIPDPSSGQNGIIHAGEAIGLLLALTYANDIIIPVESWIEVPTPSANTWTVIPDPA